MRKPRLREIESLSQAHIARKCRAGIWTLFACTAHKALLVLPETALRSPWWHLRSSGVSLFRTRKWLASVPFITWQTVQISYPSFPSPSNPAWDSYILPPKSFFLISSAVEYGPPNNAKYSLCCHWISCLLSRMETLAWVCVLLKKILYLLCSCFYKIWLLMSL